MNKIATETGRPPNILITKIGFDGHDLGSRIVPDGETDLLTSAGVAHIFHPGAARDDIVSKISALTVTARANAS